MNIYQMNTWPEMKVCFLCRRYAKSSGHGGDRYAYEVISHLVHMGIEAEVIEQGRGNILWNEFIKFPIKLAPVKADLYHALLPPASHMACFLRKFPLITTIHDIYPYIEIAPSFKEYSYYKENILKNASIIHKYYKFINKFSRYSEKIISINQTINIDIETILKVPSEKIEVIHLGVDHSFFRPLPEVKNNYAREKIILYIGGVLRMRGVDSLIKAFRLVSNEMNNTHLLIGGKIYDESLRELIYELNLDRKVRFLGHVPEEKLPFYYNCASIAVIPYEALLPILEAMACETPVITIDTPSVREYVGDGGVLVNTYDEKKIAEAVLYFLTNEKSLKYIARKGFERSQLFSWKNTAKRTLGLYKEVLE